MNDQATMLRQMMELERPEFPDPDPSVPVILVGSGKGGVGKSVCAAVIASALADAGSRTLLVDADLNLANLHLLLGASPNYGLDRVLYGEIDPSELLQRITPNLAFFAGDSGSDALHGLGAIDRARLHHRVTSLFAGFDSVVVDAGAGIDSVVRVATMNPTSMVVVTAPEPAAITDAYALVKLANFQAADLSVGVIVNRCLNEGEGPAAFAKLAEATDRFLGRKIEQLAFVPEDIAVLRAVRNPGAILGERPESLAIALLRRMALEMLNPDAVALDVQSLASTTVG